MAARNSDTAAGKTGEGPKSAAQARPSPDAVARALVEVEQTLERLKQVRAERAEVEQRFQEEIEAREGQIARAQAERDEQAARLADAECRLARLEADLGTERVTREAAESRLAQAASDAASQTERFRVQLAEAEQRERELGDTRDRERRDAEAAIEELRRRLADAENTAGERVLELRDALDGLESRAAAAERRAAESESSFGQAELRAGESAGRLDAANARIAALESVLAARAGDADQAAQDAAIFERKVAEQTAELERLSSEIGRFRVELSAAHASIAERDQQLASAGAAAQAGLADLRARLERRESEAGELLEALEAAEQAARAGAAAGADAAASIEAVRGEAEERLALARSEFDAALESERAQSRELHDKLDLAADRLVEMQNALDERDRELGRAGDAGGTIAHLSGELNDLRDRLAAAEGQRDAALARCGGEATPPARHQPDERATLRRQRLRRGRALLRDRALRVGRSERVLEQRLKQCDEVLARRRELVEARRIIEKAHKKIVSGRARSGASAVVFFAVAIVAVLSGLSWAVVTRTFPATYAASAVVAADFNGQEPQPGDLEAWQDFHEELLGHPNLVIRVAERMAQRGFTDLGQPAAVKAMLDADMTVSTPEDGKLAVELRGKGSDATIRKLDTFVTTFAVEANALRQRRTEASTTVVAEKARAGAEPIEDPRLEYAGLGIAAGTLVAFILWAGLWRRMAKSKHAFEHATEIEGLLEEAKWVDPIQQIMDSSLNGASDRAA